MFKIVKFYCACNVSQELCKEGGGGVSNVRNRKLCMIFFSSSSAVMLTFDLSTCAEYSHHLGGSQFRDLAPS